MPLNPAKTLTLLAGIATALLGTVPSWADAIVYSGTLGSNPILMELTDPADGPVVGRYTFPSVGADVPMHEIAPDNGQMTLAEEVPCTEELCPDTSSDEAKPPLGDHWQFEGAIGDAQLNGTRPFTGTAYSLPFRLTRVGTRPYDREESYLYGSFVWQTYNGSLTLQTSPYDYLKMQVPLDGDTIILPGGSYHKVTDPRTRFPYPRVVSLADGSDTTAINGFLSQQHWMANGEALACMSTRYFSGGWNTGLPGGYSELGDYDFKSHDVLYLSPRLMTITDSGSTNCGGASPNNHPVYTTANVVTGEVFDPSLVLKGWVPTKDGAPADLATARAAPQDYRWGPDADLQAYITQNRPKDPDYDADCEIDASLAENLEINFAEGDRVVFGLTGLNQAVCEGPFFDVPLADIAPLLAPEAPDFFPSLKR